MNISIINNNYFLVDYIVELNAIIYVIQYNNKMYCGYESNDDLAYENNDKYTELDNEFNKFYKSNFSVINDDIYFYNDNEIKPINDTNESDYAILSTSIIFLKYKMAKKINNNYKVKLDNNNLIIKFFDNTVSLKIILDSDFEKNINDQNIKNLLKFYIDFLTKDNSNNLSYYFDILNYNPNDHSKINLKYLSDVLDYYKNISIIPENYRTYKMYLRSLDFNDKCFGKIPAKYINKKIINYALDKKYDLGIYICKLESHIDEEIFNKLLNNSNDHCILNLFNQNTVNKYLTFDKFYNFIKKLPNINNINVNNDLLQIFSNDENNVIKLLELGIILEIPVSVQNKDFYKKLLRINPKFISKILPLINIADLNEYLIVFYNDNVYNLQYNLPKELQTFDNLVLFLENTTNKNYNNIHFRIENISIDQCKYLISKYNVCPMFYNTYMCVELLNYCLDNNYGDIIPMFIGYGKITVDMLKKYPNLISFLNANNTTSEILNYIVENKLIGKLRFYSVIDMIKSKLFEPEKIFYDFPQIINHYSEIKITKDIMYFLIQNNIMNSNIIARSIYNNCLDDEIINTICVKYPMDIWHELKNYNSKKLFCVALSNMDINKVKAINIQSITTYSGSNLLFKNNQCFDIVMILLLFRNDYHKFSYLSNIMKIIIKIQKAYRIRYLNNLFIKN